MKSLEPVFLETAIYPSAQHPCTYTGLNISDTEISCSNKRDSTLMRACSEVGQLFSFNQEEVFRSLVGGEALWPI